MRTAPITVGGAPHGALRELAGGLLGDGPELATAELRRADELPVAARELLDHHEHMTLRLGRYYRQPVVLDVLAMSAAADVYERKIRLWLADRTRVVEFGVVRLRLAHLAPAVRAEIVAQQAPLGEILVRHEVLRDIQPHWYFWFPGGGEISASFESTDAGEIFGRVGTIFCDGQPAIELLEVVRVSGNQAE